MLKLNILRQSNIHLCKCKPWMKGENIGGVSDNKLQKRNVGVELEGVNLSAEGEILLEFVNLDITRIKDKKGKPMTWA